MKRLRVVLSALLVVVVCLSAGFAQDKPPVITGAWKLVSTLGGQTNTYRIDLKQEDGKYSGTLTTAEGDAVPLTKISFVGNTMKFTVAAPEGDYDTESKVEGRTMKGTFSAPNGEKGKFEATKLEA